MSINIQKVKHTEKKMHEHYYFGWLETEKFEMKICDLCKLTVVITLFLKRDWIGWFGYGICLYAFTYVYQNDMQLYRNTNAGVKLVSMHINKYLFTVCIQFWLKFVVMVVVAFSKYFWSFNYG